ncbi:MAG: tRNA (adenosine(37)-N6)-dimethylallyltransferase MiaA [Phycisphaerae bacterium]|nr:tRNA (adenosine(37)-N6)-dimethylallyltransferase MiaA [Phycisphaerae bacterium]
MPVQLNLLVGCTAVGKTEASLRLAERFDAEIVSVDSMQVYRRMDIGTAKPSPDERRRVRHHLIDIVEPGEAFSVGRFVEHADAAIADVTGRGKTVWAVGGTALYIKALVQGLFDGPPADPSFRSEFRRRVAAEGPQALHAKLAAVDPHAAGRIHPNDTRRIERALEVHHLTGTPISELQRQWDQGRTRYDCRMFLLARDREDQNHRINARVKQMFEAGLLEEVRRLLDEPVPLSQQARQALGYAEVIDCLTGGPDLDKTIELIKIHTRRFAKSQRTWFRSFQNACRIDLAPDTNAEEVVARISEKLQG